MSRPVRRNEGEAILPSPNVYRLADHISGDRFGEQEYPAGDPATGQHADDRVLATVLFTDIVEFDAATDASGDVAWRLLLDDHDKLAHRLVDQHRGRLIKTTGDGILASFDGPGRAIKCAMTFSAPPLISGSSCDPGCTPARLKYAAMILRVSRSMSPLES